MDPILTSVIDTSLDVGQSLFNHHLAEKSADRQYQRQLDFWHKQNDYNSPLAQRQRFEQAGMNPMSATGQMATSATAQQLSSAPGNEYAQQGVFKLDALSSVLERVANIERLSSEADLNASKMVTEAIKQSLLGMGFEEKEVEIAIKHWEERSAEKKYQRIDEYIDAEIKRIQAQGNEAQANANSVTTKLPFEIEKITSEISLNDMTTILRDAETKEAKAIAANQYAQSRLTNINANLASKYGDAKAAAELKDAQTKAQYCSSLLQSTLDLQASTIMLNQNQALTNDARVVIEQQVQDLKERYYQLENDKFSLEKNKFELEAVKTAVDAVDAVTSIIDTATPW